MLSTRRLVLLPLAGLAVAASGCVTIQSTSTAQPESMGPVRLTVTACASESPNCAAGNTASLFQALDKAGSDSTFKGQPLVAVRLPDGVAPPDSFNAVAANSALIPFTRSGAYEAALQQLEPAPAGERWWGWVGGQIGYGRRTAQSFTYTITVPLPRPADGGALPSPMRWRPVVGARSVSDLDGLPASRPVDCGTSADDLYGGFDEQGGSDVTTVCVSSPTPDATRGYLEAPLTDFGLTGETVTTPAGATASVLFLATRSGAADGATAFSLSVAGGPPGATVTLDRTTASLSAQVTPVRATVAVAAGTPAGSYPLTVTATAPGKPTRTATATVVVTAPPAPGGGSPDPAPSAPGAPSAPSAPAGDRTPPVLRATLARVRGRVVVRVGLSERATVAAKVDRRRPLRRVARKGSSSFALATRGLRAGRHTVTLVATDAAGNRSKPVRRTFAVAPTRRSAGRR